MNKKNIFGFVFLLAILASGYLLWQNKYNIYDWYALRNYQPSSQISTLASQSGMNSYGQKLFYVNDPAVSNKEQFSKECNNNKEQTIVLGCFTGTNIYVYNVSDARLQGVEEVTAAHEMLHAAYARLSSTEKEKVDKLTSDAFQRINNPRISGLVDSYRSQDPSVVPNELHSILGTEVANLGPGLEQYYAKYFTDRSRVVGFSQAYEGVFSELKNQVEKYDADLNLRKSEIGRLEQNLNQQSDQLASMKKQMERYSSSGQTAAFNTMVPAYNQQVNDYNSQAADYKNLLQEYNNLVQERNKLATQQQGLVESLDSRVKTIQ